MRLAWRWVGARPEVTVILFLRAWSLTLLAAAMVSIFVLFYSKFFFLSFFLSLDDVQGYLGCAEPIDRGLAVLESHFELCISYLWIPR